ncbi:MAG TPA: pitrilysin family protein [Thermoanaerobaculia bacterium]|nr:pitrilysin family protein [Thermoanaerobaculia bacterium]
MKTKIAAACLLLSVSIPSAFAQQETPPPPAPPREAAIPKPAEKTLANGLRIVVVQKKGLPLVAARLAVKTGAEADPADLAGLADTTASLLTKGTATRSAEQIARGVEALGATIESAASWDFSYVAMSALASNFDQAARYLADVVRRPTFKADELERLREQNLDALQVALRQPNTLANMVAMRVIFGAAPYGHNLGGTPESLERITRTDVVAFHRTYYRPDNAVLVIAGDIQPAAGFALAEKLLGGWAKPSAPIPVRKADEAKAPAPRVVVVDMPDAGQAAVLVARQGIRRADPAYSVAQVANSILGGGYSARLNQEIRIRRGLSYGATSTFDFRRDPGPFTAGAQTKNESAAEVAGILVDELNRMAKTPVAESEMTPRKAVLLGSFARSLETTGGLVARFANLAVYGLHLTEISRYLSAIQGVTAEQVQAFAAERLGGGTMSVVIVGDAKKFLEPLRQRFENVDVIPLAKLRLDSPSLR